MWNIYLKRDECFPPHLDQKELVLLIYNYVKVSTFFAFHRGLKWIPNVIMISPAISLLKEVFVCSMYYTFPCHCPRYLCINFVYFLWERKIFFHLLLWKTPWRIMLHNKYINITINWWIRMCLQWGNCFTTCE